MVYLNYIFVTYISFYIIYFNIEVYHFLIKYSMYFISNLIYSMVACSL